MAADDILSLVIFVLMVGIPALVALMVNPEDDDRYGEKDNRKDDVP